MPADFIPDDEARDRRLAAIRARRGSPERLARIEAMQAAKAPKPASPSASTGTGKKTPENSSSFFGHPWPEWFAMRDAGYEHLVERARERRMTTYGELWDAVAEKVGVDLGNPWRQIDHLLGYIGEAAYEKDGVTPTALVTYPGDGDVGPGPGYFQLAVSLGLFPARDAPSKPSAWKEMTDGQRQFWETQRDLMFERFAAEQP